MHRRCQNSHRLAWQFFSAPKPSQGRTDAFLSAKTLTGSHGAISALEGTEDERLKVPFPAQGRADVAWALLIPRSPKMRTLELNFEALWRRTCEP